MAGFPLSAERFLYKTTGKNLRSMITFVIGFLLFFTQLFLHLSLFTYAYDHFEKQEGNVELFTSNVSLQFGVSVFFFMSVLNDSAPTKHQKKL